MFDLSNRATYIQGKFGYIYIIISLIIRLYDRVGVAKRFEGKEMLFLI